MAKVLVTFGQFLLCLYIFLAYSYAGFFGPSNYEECVLENMKGVNSDLGAKIVADACRKKFPTKKTKSNKPPPSEALEVQKFSPELDENGFKVCRVMSENGEWKFVTKEKLAKLKNVKETEFETHLGEIFSIVAPKGRTFKDDDERVDLIEIQYACEYFQKFGKNLP